MNALRIQQGDHSIACRRMGSGPPVLLVHGITTCSFIWRQIQSTLALHFDVMAVDLLGCGDSAKPLTESYGLQAHAERLSDLLRGLQLGPVHLVGHDLGGGIAQIMAVRHPDQLRTLALLNPVGYNLWPVQPIVALRTPIIREMLMATVDIGALRLLVRRGLFHKERLTHELLELFARPLQTVDGRKAFLHFARCLDNRDLTSISPQLQEIRLPTLIVRGDADPYLSRTITDRLHADIPGSHLERIPTASHYLQEDEPETTTQLLQGFLSTHTAP